MAREVQVTESPTLLERAGTAAAGIGSIGAGRPRTRAALQYGLVVLIFGFLIAFVATQWGKLPDFDWRFEPGWLALAAVAVTVFFLIQVESWRFILGRLGEELDPRQARAVWGKSLLARYVPTNALMVVGRVVLAERHGVPGRVCLASIVYELGLMVCGAVIVGSYFVITLPVLEGQPVRFAVLVVIPVALATLHPRVFEPLAGFALRKLGRDPLPVTLPFRTVLTLVLVYVVAWSVVGLGVFAFASALHPVEVGELVYVAASQSIAFGVAVLTFVVPSGLGTRDATLATAMSAVLPLAVATAIAVAFRIFQIAIELLFVAAVSTLARRASERNGDGEHPGAEDDRRDQQPAIAREGRER